MHSLCSNNSHNKYLLHMLCCNPEPCLGVRKTDKTILEELTACCGKQLYECYEMVYKYNNRDIHKV